MRTMFKRIVTIAALSCVVVAAKGVEVSPLVQVGPKVERWGWDIKAWPERLNSLAEADFLYGQTPANLIRVPIFATAHEQDGTIDTSAYSTELTAVRNVQRVNTDVEVFVSLKLQGGDTYPDWLGDGTVAWPQSNGTIFSNVVERPNPEHYSMLLADYVEYLQQFRIRIDYLGLNNETDGALGVDRYIDTIDRLEAELVARGVPQEYRSFQYVGPDTFGLNGAESIVNDIANQGRLDTVDVVGSHFYPQHGSGHESSWTDIATITGGAPMWHTEVHMPIGNSQYSGDPQQAYRDTLSVLFASNKRGVDSFVWWDSGHETDKVNDTIKRELVNTMVDAHAIETTPGFTAKEDSDDEPLYQAYVKGDLLTLWIANPGPEISLEVLNLAGATVLSTPTSIYWEGVNNTISSANSGELDIVVNPFGDELRIHNLPGDATMFLQFRFALGAGDYDRDGDVDIADYQSWKNSYGSTSDLLADGNNDGIVDAADFTVWRDAFNALSSETVNAEASVPEATSINMIVVLLSTVLAARRRNVASDRKLRLEAA